LSGEAGKLILVMHVLKYNMVLRIKRYVPGGTGSV
jgi:hypothetical protein